MPYSQRQRSEIIQKAMSRIRHEFEVALDDADVDAFMAKYSITFEEEAMPVDARASKILIFGALSGNVDDFKMAAKKLGISQDNLVFENDYDHLKHYNVERLRNSFEYSDIIFGPNPHKQVGMGDTNSFLAEVQRCPHEYPRVIPAVANGALKISISSFKEALMKTRYFELAA